jgi:hypothetical protein
MKWFTIIFFAVLFGCGAEGPRQCDINTAGKYSTNNMGNLRKCVEADGQYGWLKIDPTGCKGAWNCSCGTSIWVDVLSDGSSYSCKKSCSSCNTSSSSSHYIDK